MQAPRKAVNEPNVAQAKANMAAGRKAVVIDNRPAMLAQRKLPEMMNDSDRAKQLRAIDGMMQAKPQTNSATQPVQLQPYRNAPWTNPDQYTNTAPFLETIEGNAWMKIQALTAYPHIQEPEIDAARGGAAPAVTMAASNGDDWRDYAPRPDWGVAVDPSHTVLSMRGLSAHLVMPSVDNAWGSSNVGEEDIRHLGTHSGVYPPAHRHTVMPPGSTITAASLVALARSLGARRKLDVGGAGGFKWATADADQKLAEVNTWAGNLAANLL